MFIEMVAEGAGKGAKTVFKENNIVTTFCGKLLCSVMGAELGAELGAWRDIMCELYFILMMYPFQLQYLYNWQLKWSSRVSEPM